MPCHSNGCVKVLFGCEVFVVYAHKPPLRRSAPPYALFVVQPAEPSPEGGIFLIGKLGCIGPHFLVTSRPHVCSGRLLVCR
ncbi:protein of unknown function (plasmid) [Caballeronia sp. S22]